MRRTQPCPQCGCKCSPEEVQGLCPRCLRRMLARLDEANPALESRTNGKEPCSEPFDRVKRAIRNGSQVVLALMLLATPALPAQVVQVNRTLPKVAPPKTTLEFSAQPTTQEISRARVFEE